MVIKACMTSALALALAGISLAGAQQQQTPPAAQEPAAQGAPAAPPKPARTPKSPEEGAAIQAVLQGATADERIAAAENFLKTYPESDFRALALVGEAQAYQLKNNNDKVVLLAEQSLDAKPTDAWKLEAYLMLARSLAQTTHENDLDREEKLTRSAKYANSALDLLKTIENPNPALTDEQWDGAKANFAAEAHHSLGLEEYLRKNWTQAIAELKMAVEMTKDPDPVAEVRLAAAYEKAGKYDEAIAMCDKLMAMPDLHPSIRHLAQAERARSYQAKGGVPKPAPAPAPAAAPAPAVTAAPATPAPAPAPEQKPKP
jgi:tetratricopeptide (TPR) repeat protein